MHRTSTLALAVFAFILIATFANGILNYALTYFTPAMHDELSYLFQTRTFLLGRVTNPVHPLPEFFDAYHIINEGVFASKYFPGFAITLMPFAHFGIPYFQPILCYGLQLLLIFLIGRELFGYKTAWAAMVLVSISPQVMIHTFFLFTHPLCSVLLLLFFFGFARTERGGGGGWALLSSMAWGAAFLTRPLTAVGVGLPIGLYLLYRLRRGKIQNPVRFLALWGLPVVMSVMLLCAYNKAVTGEYLKTPFSQYAEVHAPFHRYGFNPWDRFADQDNGPRVDTNFNYLYKNHTPSEAILRACVRLSSWNTWIIGDNGFAALGLIFWLFAIRNGNKWLLMIFAMWISLQLVHVPHFFSGIDPLGSNFLYEVSALAILCMVKAGADILRHMDLDKQRSTLLAGAGLILCATLSAMFIAENKHHVSNGKWLKIALHTTIQGEGIEKGVVFIRYADGHNIHLDLIDNVPTLDSPIIYARDRGADNEKLREYFPDHPFYIYDERTGFVLPMD